MDKTEIKIGNDVIARLVDQPDVAFLLGWAEGNTIICIGCARDIRKWENISDLRISAQQAVSSFPAGIGVIGLSQSCSDDIAFARSESLFRQFLSYGVEDSIVGPILAFLYRPSIDEDTSDGLSQHALTYDTRIARSSQARLRIVDGNLLTSYTIALRIRGNMALSFETSTDSNDLRQNIEKAFTKIKDKVSSPTSVYHLQKSTLLLRNTEGPNHPKLKANSKCSALTACIEDDEEEGDGYQHSKQKKKNTTNTSNRIFNVKLLVQTTGEAAVQQTISCSPVIRYERRDFTNVSVVLGIDVMAMVPSAMPISSLSSLITNGVNTQLSVMQQTLCRFYQDYHRFHLPKVYHYLPATFNHIVSVIYPDRLPDSDLEEFRREMHIRLFIPLDRPALRKPMQHCFPDECSTGGYLRNVHLGLPPSGVTDGQIGLVQGTYNYHHYMQDRMNDDGWGCAYRSLQTLVSWFVHQGYTDAPIPTHSEIQQALVDVGDKPPSFVKSRKWIGSMEVSFCLDKLIGVNSKIISVSSGAELASKGRELLNHFNWHGTPIMIGGGVLAHTILGVDVNLKTGDVKFLILDPHYTGSEDLNLIQAKGWCGWKGPNFWDQTAYYNLCCPQRPPGI